MTMNSDLQKHEELALEQLDTVTGGMSGTEANFLSVFGPLGWAAATLVQTYDNAKALYDTLRK
jgi:hypothetical protein